MGMTAGSIVKDFDVIEDVGARQITGFVDAFSHAPLFKIAIFFFYGGRDVHVWPTRSGEVPSIDNSA
ncbi:hypothetical protein AB870_24665 (plasmid) [Pandoraea faecigallinarum]|uniref:Uncharacterized protein n=1 Tax=Pandoraea faecigallinarum TaxID=656179 RepID=A0A0H3X083_9BURK|nr:hypothetical protein AB870_24665 [Pandoraea faecigallinarum]